MASCSRRKLEADDARRDVISEVPANVKEMILERLLTRDAARTALLSTQWKDAWLRLGRLEFDSSFFRSVRESRGYSYVPFVKIITSILLQRVRPVKKFSLYINYLIFMDTKFEPSDLDQWYLFLSRNGVEELHITYLDHQYKLPFCVVSCPTIKQLRLNRLAFDCPINAPPNFPCFSSLTFWCVVFNHNANGIVSILPNLEKLDFQYCRGIGNFKINAPKLESLSITDSGVESGWFALHLKTIKVLCLKPKDVLWEDAEVASFPTAINLQVIKLHSLEFANEKQLKCVLQLLQKSPNLCELDIKATRSDDDIEAASRLLKDLDSCIINQDLKLLKTIKINKFCGCTIEMLFVEMLLSKSPILERVVITEDYYRKNSYMVINILRELLCIPRASPKAKIVIKGKVYV